MIIDSFIYFNEESILDVRLNELYDKVDKFVLVEADHKFNNEKKPFYYLDNIDKYNKFKDKIVHVSIQKNESELKDPKSNESFLRDSVVEAIRGLDAPDDSIVMLSDADEIPKLTSENISLMRLIKDKEFLVFEMPIYYYYFNCIQNYQWPGTVAARKSTFVGCRGEGIRENRFVAGKKIKMGGWHFSYMGGPSMIREKILSGSDTWVVEKKDDYGSIDNIKECLDSVKDLYHRKEKDKQCHIVGSELPLYIEENREKFKEFFYEKY